MSVAACCLPGGACVEVEQSHCDALGGIWHGGRTCEFAECAECRTEYEDAYPLGGKRWSTDRCERMAVLPTLDEGDWRWITAREVRATHSDLAYGGDPCRLHEAFFVLTPAGEPVWVLCSEQRGVMRWRVGHLCIQQGDDPAGVLSAGDVAPVVGYGNPPTTQVLYGRQQVICSAMS